MEKRAFSLAGPTCEEGFHVRDLRMKREKGGRRAGGVPNKNKPRAFIFS